MDWTWQWQLGEEVYSFGDNPVVDAVRLLVVVGGVALALAMLGIIRKYPRMALPQQARFFALAMADLYISVTEVAVMGSPGTPRLIVGVLAVAAGAVGIWGMQYNPLDDRNQK